MTQPIESELYLLVGPSGAGKTSVMDELYREGTLIKATSHATRPMREGESQGNPYHFISVNEYKGLDLEGQFIEKIEYNGNHYGFTRGEVLNALERGDVGLIVEGHGAAQIRKLFPGRVTTIFLDPPPREELVRRMRQRKNTQAEIEERLALMVDEMKFGPEADYHVDTNDSFDHVLTKVRTIIKITRARRQNKTEGL
jgi:guanylate kinase